MDYPILDTEEVIDGLRYSTLNSRLIACDHNPEEAARIVRGEWGSFCDFLYQTKNGRLFVVGVYGHRDAFHEGKPQMRLYAVEDRWAQDTFQRMPYKLTRFEDVFPDVAVREA